MNFYSLNNDTYSIIIARKMKALTAGNEIILYSSKGTPGGMFGQENPLSGVAGLLPVFKQRAK
jgi:hypothetical protein